MTVVMYEIPELGFYSTVVIVNTRESEITVLIRSIY